MSGPCGRYGWTVAGAERGRAVQGQTLQNFVALPSQDLFGFISQNSPSPGVPEDDVLVQVDGEGAVGGCFQPVQYVHVVAYCWESDFRRAGRITVFQ